MREHQRLGSYDWSERTNGFLSTTDVLSLFSGLVGAQVGDLADALLFWTPGFKKRMRRVSYNDVIVPDSKLARDTVDYARSEYDEPLLLHCYRTYAFGALFAQARKMTYDHELLFVSSILHDLGLISDGGARKKHTCFAVDGARRTKFWLEQQGWDEDRAIRAYEAVSYHLNAHVSATRSSVEAHLLASGAALDVIGGRHRQFPAEEIRHVHASYPRDGFIDGIIDTMTDPHAPRSRAYFLMKVGFRKMTVRNPLERNLYAPK